MIITELNGIILKDMIISAANHLENNQKTVNELNVFPVPDGDTGTNMSLTLSAASKEVKQYDNESISFIADILASASLRAARGNSGVILSQLFRGFAKELKGYDVINATIFAKALKTGVDTAYRAVMKPTEGTILTVARESARRAMAVSENTDNIIEVLEQAMKQANETLQKTPDMLPTLKQAGVVDAGGKGLIFIMEGALNVLITGQGIQRRVAVSEQEQESFSHGPAKADGNIQFSYCTEFIINKHHKQVDVNQYKNIIKTQGDSMLVIDDDDIIKTHIHTNNPGIVIQEALKLGWLTNIKIDNMKEQHNHLIAPKKEDVPKKKYAFIAVANGDGMVKILKDLGVDEVIQGGQTMNPSTDSILNAVNQLNAEFIFILPNNKNIILAAEQAKHLTDKNIVVVPTKSVVQGIASMVVFNPDEDSEENFNNMMEVLENVKTGQVTYAVRDTKYEDKEIKEGDILGLVDNQIVNTGNNVNDTCKELLDFMIDENSSMITIYYGADVSHQDAEEIAAYAKEHFEDCEVELYDGGQPLYYYTISVE